MGHDVDSIGSTYRTNHSRLGARLSNLGQAWPAAGLRLQREVVARATATGYDLVLTVEATLLPESVARIRRNGSAVALWFGDAVVNLGRQLMFLGDYSLICFKDAELVRRCRAVLAANVIYLPEACNPSWHRPSDVPIEPVVVTAGNMYAFRMRLLERLVKAGIPLRIYGPPWARWLQSKHLEPFYTGRYIAREEKARIFRSAGVVLNTIHPGEMASVNCRLFEAAGCGSAVLTDCRPGLNNLFKIGDEVQTFDSFDSLVARAGWMLEHPGEARRMGDAAAARAHMEHTYDVRLQQLLASLP
jgi:spore maturation protein CgeB